MQKQTEKTEIRDALEAYRPELEKRYRRNVERVFENIVSDLGVDLKGVYNSWAWAKVFSNVIKPHFNTGTKKLNETKLAAGAKEYASATVEAWVEKISAKLGELDEATVSRLDGCRFRIHGKRDGRSVSIDQDMIVNVSSRGTLFNQFPARIYVDGKFTSAKKYLEVYS